MTDTYTVGLVAQCYINRWLFHCDCFFTLIGLGACLTLGDGYWRVVSVSCVEGLAVAAELVPLPADRDVPSDHHLAILQSQPYLFSW